MHGAVDLSPWAARQISEDQERELWARAREQGVLVSVAEVREGGFFASIAGPGCHATARHDDAYLAALSAFQKAVA